MIKGLMGQTNNTIDSKGRFIVPVRFRSGLGDEFVMCQGMDHNIFAYPESEWEKFADKLSTLPISRPDTRRFREFFEGSAVNCEVDGQSRSVIPQQLREFAGIEKDVVIVGHTTYLAIWSKEAWDKIRAETSDNIQELFESVGAEYGI